MGSWHSGEQQVELELGVNCADYRHVLPSLAPVVISTSVSGSSVLPKNGE
jgi:hypothetical protein